MNVYPAWAEVKQCGHFFGGGGPKGNIHKITDVT